MLGHCERCELVSNMLLFVFVYTAALSNREPASGVVASVSKAMQQVVSHTSALRDSRRFLFFLTKTSQETGSSM